MSKKPKYLTAVVLFLPEDGSSVISDLNFNSPDIEIQRKATLDDLYRMVCDAKSQLESIRTVNHHFNQLRIIQEAVEKHQQKIIIGKA